MIQKLLASRKFTSAILTALLIGLNDGLGLGLKPETLELIVAIVASFILGESAIDAASAWGGQAANGKNSKGTPSPSLPGASPPSPPNPA